MKFRNKIYPAFLFPFSIFAENIYSYMYPVKFCCKDHSELRPLRYTSSISTSVAPLDVRPTGDQEVPGSTSAGLATFFHGD